MIAAAAVSADYPVPAEVASNREVCQTSVYVAGDQTTVPF